MMYYALLTLHYSLCQLVVNYQDVIFKGKITETYKSICNVIRYWEQKTEKEGLAENHEYDNQAY